MIPNLFEFPGNNVFNSYSPALFGIEGRLYPPINPIHTDGQLIEWSAIGDHKVSEDRIVTTII